MQIIFLLSSHSNSSPSTFFKHFASSLPTSFQARFFYVKPKSCSLKSFYSHFLSLLRLLKLANSQKCLVFSQGFSSDLFRVLFLPNSFSASFCRGELTKDYQLSCGYIGYLLGVFHLYLISQSTCPVTMHPDMQFYFFKFTRKPSFLMYNYNDDSTRANSVPIISVCSRDNINISVVGSLCRRKNVEEAIFIFYGFLQQTSRDLYLNIFGTGPRETILRKLVDDLQLSSNVRFFGHKSPSFIQRHTNILMHSSISEGTSRAVIEALQSSSIVIHRNISGSYSIIDNGLNGFIYETPSHAVSLWPKIIKLHDSLNSDLDSLPDTKALSLLPDHFSNDSFKSSVAKLISNFPILNL